MKIPEGATHKKRFQFGEIYFRRCVDVIDCFGVDYELPQWQFYDIYQERWVNCNHSNGLKPL
ncbi:hypothetical protein NVP1087A_22 [Vibrio phage 1.087.A._10N.261.45.F9]|nr:hypothetical protein NVP1087A_22 [Vibrio phage 1.087.A._10N.261.45.F9]